MKLITCEFNMDSSCVAMRFDDGAALDIDCTVVESEYAHTVWQKRNWIGWFTMHRWSMLNG